MANPQTENGFIKIAKEIAEALMTTNLSAYQSRFLWALWYKTWGWNKKEDWISNSQLVEMTGLAKGHVSRTKKELLMRNIIVTNSGNKISFQKDYSWWEKLDKGVRGYQGVVTNSGNTQKVTNSGKSLPESSPTVTNSGEHKRKKILQKNIICEVFDYWKQVMDHPGAKLTSDRKTKIGARLKDKYTVEDIKLGVDGCKLSPHNMGENERNTVYDDIELICRNGSKLERFINKAKQKQKVRYAT